MFREQLSAGVITIAGLLLVGLSIDGDSNALLGIAKGSMLIGLGLLMAHKSSRWIGTSEPRT